MDSIRFLFLFLIAIAAASCSQKSETMQKLEVAEELYYDYDYKSAEKVLNNINKKDLDTKELEAFFNLLKSEILYRCENIRGEDSLINTSIEYYKHSGNKEKLALAYYIRALLLYDDSNENVLLDLKNAETLAEKFDNPRLNKRIYAALAFFYSDSDEFYLSLQYARKEYECLKKIDSEKSKAYTLLNLSASYDRTGHKDSAAWCVQECEKYVDQLEPLYQAYLFYGLGSAYAESDRRRAEEYLRKSLELNPLPQTYTLLSDIYMAEGKPQMAENLWMEVMQMRWDELKIRVLDAKLEYDYQNGDFEEYRNTQKARTEATERYYEDRLQNKALELENKYNLNLYQQKIRSRVIITSLAGTLLVAVLVLLHRIRVRRVDNRRMKAELDYGKAKSTLAMFEERIAVLESDKKSKTKELSVLKEKAGNLKNEMRTNLQRGHDLYDKLKRNESPALWTDNDYLCLFDFVSTIDQELAVGLEVNYGQLSNDQKLFLIIDNLLKKDDNEICQMLGLEKQSLRNKRSRIAKKRVVEN